MTAQVKFVTAVERSTSSVKAVTFASPYVRSDAGSLAGVLMLNPSARFDRLVPLKAEPSPIGERVREQFGILRRTLNDRGVQTIVLDAATESTTECLVGDCAVMLADGAVIMRPSAIERRHDVAAIERALVDLGVPIIGRIVSPGLLDGGDVAIGGDTAYVGLRRNGSNVHGRRQFEAILRDNGIHTIELAVGDEIMRLRNVFSFVAADMVVAAPSKVDIVPASALRVIEIPRGEEYAAGILALGERRVIANLRFRTAITIMRKAKIAVDAIDLWEFGKVGVGPFSLALAMKRA